MRAATVLPVLLLLPMAPTAVGLHRFCRPRWWAITLGHTLLMEYTPPVLAGRARSALVVFWMIVYGVAALFASGSAAGAAEPSPQVVQAGTWSWPVDAPWRILRGFEAPATVYSAGHRGIDLEASAGSAVYAPEAGVVSFSGRVVDRPVVSISHFGELISSVEPVQPIVAKGQLVARGQQIGSVGTGGHCGLRCVHFGVRLRGRYVSPMLFLGGVPRAVLLPVPGR